MLTCCSVLWVVTFATIFTSKIATSDATSHFVPGCAYGHRFRNTCYKIGDGEYGYRRHHSGRTCQLVVIKDAEENEFVKGLLVESGTDYAWIGEGDGSYSNFGYSRSGECFDMDDHGKWYAYRSSYCRVEQRSVCVWKLDCEEGWLGANCDIQCHCYQENCTRNQDTCRYGCTPGWTGRNCRHEAAPPIVEHYCFKHRTHYALMLTKNSRSQETGSLVPLDLDGYPISPEKYTDAFNGSDVFEISTTDLTLPFQPNYHERKIDDGIGTTFEWSLRFRQHTRLRLQSDIDFTVRCNFSEADLMYSSTSLQFDKTTFGKPALSSPLPTEVDVELDFRGTKDNEILTNITIGQPVKFVMKQNYANTEQPGKGEPLSLSPRACFARSPDNKMVKQITNELGCKLVDDYFEWPEAEKNEDFMTTPFAAFGLPGYANLNISCNLAVCFEDGYRQGLDCRKPCRY